MRYSFISPQLALRLFYLSQHNVLGCCANCGQFRRLGRFSVWIWNVLQYCACPSIEVCLFVHSPNSALSAKDMLLWSSYLFSFFFCCALHIISKPWKMLTLIFFTHHSDKLLIMGNSRPWSTAVWMQFPMEMLSLWIKKLLTHTVYYSHVSICDLLPWHAVKYTHRYFSWHLFLSQDKTDFKTQFLAPNVSIRLKNRVISCQNMRFAFIPSQISFKYCSAQRLKAKMI